MRSKDTPLIHAVRALRVLDPAQRKEALVLAGIDDGDAVARDPEVPKQRRKRRKALGSAFEPGMQEPPA